MRRVTLAVVALSSLVGVGCLREPDPFDLDDSAPTVFAVLEAGADHADILIVHAGTWDQPPGYVGIDGAEVRLVHAGDTAWAAADAGHPCAGDYAYHPGGPEDPGHAEGCYHVPFDAPIEPGAEFELEIVLPSGQRVTGATRVPEPPVLLSPEPGLRITAACGIGETCYGRHDEATGTFTPVATLPVEWEMTGGPSEAALDVRGRVAYLDGQAYPEGCSLGYWSRSPESSSTEFAIPNIGCHPEPLVPARFDSIQGEVVVTALGASYVAFLDALSEGQTVRASGVSQGLDGAYGLFGGVAPARRAFTVLRDPPAAPAP